MVVCPVKKDHRLMESTDNDDRFHTYICVNCNIHIYEAVDVSSPDVMESPQIHDDYEVIEYNPNEDMNDEQLQTDMFCAEVQRCYGR